MRLSTKTVSRQASIKVPEETPPHLRRNFGLGVISGIAYNLYIVLLSTELVMTWFLSQLTRSNLLISLLVPIDLGSWCFLQLLLSGYVQRQPRALPLYRLMAGIRLAALGLLSLATFVLDEPRALLIVFLSAFTVNSLAAGVAALPFLNVVAKTVPATRRGMFFAWRRFGGGLLGLFGGALVKIVLSPGFGLGFPNNYALLFFLGLLIMAVLVGSFSFVVEPAEVVDPHRVSLGEQLRRAARLVARDRNYRCYLALRVAFVAASYALPFYAVYARRALNAPEDIVGIYLIGSTSASVLSNLIVGQLGDRWGNRLIVRLGTLVAALAPGAALLIARLPEIGWDKSLLFTLVFVFQGLYATANVIGSNYALELAPSIERVLYISFTYGVVGLALFASPLGGGIVEWLGFEPLFLFSFVCGLVAVGLSLGLEEPRKNQNPQA